MSIESGTQGAASTPERKTPGSAGAELIIPVVGCIFTLYYFSTIIDSPWTAQVSTFFIGCVLILCSAVVIFRIVREIRAGTKTFDFDILITPLDFVTKRVVLLVLTVAFIPFTQIAGFTLTTFGFLFLATALLQEGRKLGHIAALSTFLAVAGWAVFVYAFEIRFPNGPFEYLMGRIL